MADTDRFKALALALCKDMGFRPLGDEIPGSLGLCDTSCIGLNPKDESEEPPLLEDSIIAGREDWDQDFFAETLPMEVPWDHILIRPGFSNILMTALVNAEDLDASEIDQRISWLKTLAAGIEGMTWAPDMILTESRVHLTTLGLLVFETTPSAKVVKQIRASRELALFRGRRCLFWTVDLETCRTHSHGLFPVQVNPSPLAISRIVKRLKQS